MILRFRIRPSSRTCTTRGSELDGKYLAFNILDLGAFQFRRLCADELLALLRAILQGDSVGGEEVFQLADGEDILAVDQNVVR